VVQLGFVQYKLTPLPPVSEVSPLSLLKAPLSVLLGGKEADV
jgi:hypothetical protein